MNKTGYTTTTLQLNNHFPTSRTIEMLDSDVANNIEEITNANGTIRGHNNTPNNNVYTSDTKINNYGSNRRENDPTLTKIQYDNLRNRQSNNG